MPVLTEYGSTGGIFCRHGSSAPPNSATTAGARRCGRVGNRTDWHSLRRRPAQTSASAVLPPAANHRHARLRPPRGGDSPHDHSIAVVRAAVQRHLLRDPHQVFLPTPRPHDPTVPSGAARDDQHHAGAAALRRHVPHREHDRPPGTPLTPPPHRPPRQSTRAAILLPPKIQPAHFTLSPAASSTSTAPTGPPSRR